MAIATRINFTVEAIACMHTYISKQSLRFFFSYEAKPQVAETMDWNVILIVNFNLSHKVYPIVWTKILGSKKLLGK